MYSLVNYIQKSIDDLSENIVNLLSNYSSIRSANDPDDVFVLISANGDHFFNELSNDGLEVQQRCVVSFNRLKSKISPIIPLLTNDFTEQIDGICKLLDNLINQEYSVYKESIDNIECSKQFAR